MLARSEREEIQRSDGMEKCIVVIGLQFSEKKLSRNQARVQFFQEREEV